MKIKEKLKGFKEKHPELKGEASRLFWLAVGCGTGYIIGYKVTTTRINLGFERIDHQNPEIMPLIKEAIDQINSK